MMKIALFPISLAALFACTGCSVRIGAVPPATSSAGEARIVAPVNQRPPEEADERGVAQSGTLNSPAVSSPEGAPPAVVAPLSVDRETSKGPAPAATDSAYVFSKQQAASSPSESAPEAESEASAPAERVPGELQLLVVASTSEIATGGITTVDVIASSSTAVVDAPLHLTFDPAVMEFVDGTTGDFLTQGGSSVVFFADGRSRPGDVAIAAGRLERERGASGAGLLCRVRLRGIGPGTTSVAVGEARAWGAQGQELAVLKGATTVAVN